MAELAPRYKGQSVVGFGIGGDERQAAPELFRDVYAYAAKNGIRLTAHAGETAGPGSIWGAINLPAERIGHGFTASQDSELVEALSKRQIPVENVYFQQSAHWNLSNHRRTPSAQLF